jgi:YVTN family beta-propeller protein
MRARRGHQAGVGRRGGTSVRRGAAAVAVVAAAALSLTAGAVPASAAVVYTVTNTIPVGSPPSGLAVDPVTGTVYVSRAGEVSVIDAATDTVTATIPVSGGGGAGAIVADPAAGAVYVAGGNGVLVIDAATSKVTATIALSGGAGAMSVDPAAGAIYAVTGEEGPRGTVSVIDTATNKVTATISVSPDPVAVAVDPAVGTVYVANQRDPDEDGTVSVIDAATNTVTATITVGQLPEGMAVDPVAGTVYVASGPMSVIDAATSTVTATIPEDNGPDAVAVDPAAGTVYLANTNYTERTGFSDGGTVSVIDAATGDVAATVPVGIDPTAVAVDPATHAVYVANAGSGTVSVISSTQAAQAIAFTSAPPAKPVTGGTYRVAAAGGGSGNPVTVTIGAWSTSVCSISGKVVTFKAGGYCVINANQAGDAGYAPAQPAQQTVTVAAAAVKLSWTAPAAVTYGTALTGTQLDAAASVPGTFSYSPPAGTVPQAGTQTLTAAFTPADPAGYTGGTVSVKLTVRPAPLTARVAGSQTYGGTPAFTVSGYSGLVNGDTAAAVGGRLAGCATTLGSGAAPGTYPATISGCTGLSAADYAISYADAGVTVSRAALRVTASGGAMTYGGAPPRITASYAGFAHGDSAASLTTRPSCSTTATSASPPGRYPSRCNGAADPDYAISYTSGTVTVAPAGTALAYGGPQKVRAGAGLVPAAVLTSPAGACEDAQPVTFTLNANPKTGTAGTYPLETATTRADGAATGATVSTSGWQAGAYAITASYAGTSDCAPSTTTAPLAVTTRGRPRVLGRMG